MQHEEQFKIFYNQTIHPELVRLDRHRRRLLRKIFLSGLLMVVLAGVLYWLGVFVAALLASLPFGLYLSYQANEIRKFTLKFKPAVVKLVLDFIDDDLLFGKLRYDAKGQIPQERFRSSQLFMGKPSVYMAEDYIEGRVGDIEFEMCEMDVKEYSEVRNRMQQMFRGVFVHARFLHPPQGTLLVLPRATLPDLSETLKNFVAHGGQNLDAFVQHDKFRKVFAVYGQRFTKVHDVLPVEMQEFVIKHWEKQGDIFLSFIGKSVFAAIWNEKDILEPKWFKSNVSYDLVKEFYDDIFMALSLVLAVDVSH